MAVTNKPLTPRELEEEHQRIFNPGVPSIPVSDEAMQAALKTSRDRKWTESTVQRADQAPLNPRYPVPDGPLHGAGSVDNQRADSQRNVNLSTGLWDDIVNWFSEVFFGPSESSDQDSESSNDPLDQRPELARPNRANRQNIRELEERLHRMLEHMQINENQRRLENEEEWADQRTIEQHMTELRMQRREIMGQMAEVARELLVEEGHSRHKLQEQRIKQLEDTLEKERRSGLAGMFDRGVGLLTLAVSGLKALLSGSNPATAAGIGAGIALLIVLHLDEATDHKTSNKLLELLVGDDKDSKEKWQKRRDIASATILLLGTGLLGFQYGGSNAAKALVHGAQAAASGTKAVTDYQAGLSKAELTYYDATLEQCQRMWSDYSKDLDKHARKSLDDVKEASRAAKRQKQATLEMIRT